MLQVALSPERCERKASMWAAADKKCDWGWEWGLGGDKEGPECRCCCWKPGDRGPRWLWPVAIGSPAGRERLSAFIWPLWGPAARHRYPAILRQGDERLLHRCHLLGFSGLASKCHVWQLVHCTHSHQLLAERFLKDAKDACTGGILMGRH